MMARSHGGAASFTALGWTRRGGQLSGNPGSMIEARRERPSNPPRHRGVGDRALTSLDAVLFDFISPKRLQSLDQVLAR